MITKLKLSIFGLYGLAANIVFFVLFDLFQFIKWDAYLYNGGSYPSFIDSYGGLIVELNIALIFIFVGFVVGMVVCLGGNKNG